jgi:hypothetical protein
VSEGSEIELTCSDPSIPVGEKQYPGPCGE